MVFSSKAKEEFDVKSVTSAAVDGFIDKCSNIYRGNPFWVSDEDHVKTINFAKSICSEVARLTTLAIGITIDGSARANYLQEQIDNVYFQLRQWVEFGAAYGTIILKPNGDSIDVVLPGNYIVTDVSNGNIQGIVFLNKEVSENGKKFYTRLEYHRFVDDVYVITNKCFVGYSENDNGKPIDIKKTPWNVLEEEVGIEGLDKPLFAVLKMPGANNLDVNSPLSLPVYSDAIEELKDLDIAYSRNVLEIWDSEKIILMDSDKLMQAGTKVSNTAAGYEQARKNLKLPHYVRNVMGNGSEDFYQEINPQLNTSTRIEGINNILSIISFKCGFSNGYFVFNERTGVVTATQIESDDQRTIQTIKDVRDQLESCLDDLIYALDKFADLYDLAPVGVYEVTYNFGDITYNEDEDRQRWWSYVQAGKVPAWKYFEKFEGMSEEEAKAMVDEAQPKETGLFEE